MRETWDELWETRYHTYCKRKEARGRKDSIRTKNNTKTRDKKWEVYVIYVTRDKRKEVKRRLRRVKCLHSVDCTEICRISKGLLLRKKHLNIVFAWIDLVERGVRPEDRSQRLACEGEAAAWEASNRYCQAWVTGVTSQPAANPGPTTSRTRTERQPVRSTLR